MRKPRATGANASKEQFEQLDGFKAELRDEVIQLLEDDRRLRNIRFNEIYNLIEQNKDVQQELIVQQFESQKALMKAIVNREAAERMLADEDLLINVNSQLKSYKFEPVKEGLTDKGEKSKLVELDTKIEQTFQSLSMKFKNAQVENQARIDELEEQLVALNTRVAELQEDQQHVPSQDGAGASKEGGERQDTRSAASGASTPLKDGEASKNPEPSRPKTGLTDAQGEQVRVS